LGKCAATGGVASEGEERAWLAREVVGEPEGETTAAHQLLTAMGSDNVNRCGTRIKDACDGAKATPTELMSVGLASRESSDEFDEISPRAVFLAH
jgi:hypothetical protein